MSYHILQDKSAIREKIKNLFSYKTRGSKRVILINYLDAIAPNLLIDVYDVDIYCYPQPGNIDPYALEELQNKGAKIYFTSPINMNLFYVQNEGILLGSANYNLTLSIIHDIRDNSHDLLIFIDNCLLIDIEKIITLLDKKLITKSDIDMFKEKHHIFWKIYEGFESYTNVASCSAKNINNKEKFNHSDNKLKNIINNFKNIFKPKTYELTKESNDVAFVKEPCLEPFFEDIKSDIDHNSNIYTISKNELLEIIMERMSKSKRKLH